MPSGNWWPTTSTSYYQQPANYQPAYGPAYGYMPVSYNYAGNGYSYPGYPNGNYSSYYPVQNNGYYYGSYPYSTFAPPISSGYPYYWRPSSYYQQGPGGR